MNTNFFSATLQNTGLRIQSVKQPAKILLDKNEQADDIATELKMKVMERLMNTNWNRYPNTDYNKIEAKTAAYCGLSAENILLASGSASIITILLNYFALQQKRITIVQPTYSLFDYHCKTYNIPYEPWMLTPDLQFDYDNMPTLEQDSVLIITSPNNPTGNCFDVHQLETLLQKYPQACIILDNVYQEFSDVDYTALIRKYSNLIVLRSFSKAFPAAGLRLGYLCASAAVVDEIKKLVLQFSINPLSLAFADEVLFDATFMASCKMKVQQIICQRERLRMSISSTIDSDLITVYPSAGNFLLIKIHHDKAFENLMEDLEEAQIRILNTSKSNEIMKNTFRVSIGTHHENQLFLACLLASIENFSCTQQLLETLDIRA